MRSISSGNVPADWRASSGPVGKPWQSTTAGNGSGASGWPGEVRVELQTRRQELAVGLHPDLDGPPPAQARGLRWMRRLPGLASV